MWPAIKHINRSIHDVYARKPHDDIGYYDVTDMTHRRYMRDLANHFGVYGFNYICYWPDCISSTRFIPGLMLQDKEPSKPFMITVYNQ